MCKKRIGIVMAEPYLKSVALLINDGLYESQAEIIKDALRRLFRKYQIVLVTEASPNMLPVSM
jgi:Arc/MetJ-type ribon-helix-helix transcriptional regulator